MNSLKHCLLAMVLQVIPLASLSQDFPSRQVRIIAPYTPGGAVDVIGRLLAERLSKVWRQPVVVENKPGAGTVIGAELVARAAPDGYTLLITGDATITGNPHTFAKLPYDPLTDFAPITNLIWGLQMMVAHPSVSANTLQELVALAKRKPGMLNYGSFGTGSPAQLVFESLGTQTGARVTHVPYKGLAPALQAVVVGEVQLTLSGVPFARGFVQAGKLKPIAMAAAVRSPLMPEVPTLRESGFPNIDPHTWVGLLATGGTSRSVITGIHSEVRTIFTDPEFQDRQIVQKGFASAISASPEEFAAYIRSDLVYKAQLIKSAGIRQE